MLSDRCLSVCPVCPVCDVGVLWPNGWMDQDETCHAGRPRRWPRSFRWGPNTPPPKGHSPQFSAHVCCDQTPEWIKMPLGTKVGLGPGNIVLDADPVSPSTGYNPFPNFRSMSIVAKRSPISATAEHNFFSFYRLQLHKTSRSLQADYAYF